MATFTRASTTGLLLITILGCQTSVKQTNLLCPGMTTDEVQSILGEPRHTEFEDGFYQCKYSFYQFGTGRIPYYLVFDAQTSKLVSWTKNMDDYDARRQLWLRPFPPELRMRIRHEIDAGMDHDIKGSLDMKHGL